MDRQASRNMTQTTHLMNNSLQNKNKILDINVFLNTCIEMLNRTLRLKKYCYEIAESMKEFTKFVLKCYKHKN